MSDSVTTSIEERYRDLPSIDALLQQMSSELERWGHTQLTDTLREITSELRAEISSGRKPDTSIEKMRHRAEQKLATRHEASLVNVLNLTGTVLHTNLGRANLPTEALDAITAVARSASNLEFDLASGNRGDRESHVEALICERTGAEAATAVNNNAAAVLLVLNTLALNREVPA